MLRLCQSKHYRVFSVILSAIALIWVIVLFINIGSQYVPSLPRYRINFLRSDGYLDRTVYFLNNGNFQNNRVSPFFSLTLIPIALIPSHLQNIAMGVYQSILLLLILVYVYQIAECLSFSRPVKYLSIFLFSCNPVLINWYLTGQSELLQAFLLMMFIYYSISFINSGIYKYLAISYIFYMFLMLTKPTYVFLFLLYVFYIKNKSVHKFISTIIALLVIALASYVPSSMTSSNLNESGVQRVGSRAGVEMLKGTIYANNMISSMYIGTNFGSRASEPDISESGLAQVLSITESGNGNRTISALLWHLHNPLMLVRKILLNAIMFCSIGDTSTNTLLISLYNIPIWILSYIYMYRNRNNRLVNHITTIISVYLLIHIIVLGLARYLIPVYPLTSLFASGTICYYYDKVIKYKKGKLHI